MFLGILCRVQGKSKWLNSQTRDLFLAAVRSKSQHSQEALAESNTSSSEETKLPEIKKTNNPFSESLSSHQKSFYARDIKNEDINTCSELEFRDAEEERRYKVLQLEVSIASQEGKRVPSLEFLKNHHWAHILSLPTKSARQRYYGYLWQIEMRQKSSIYKKEQKKIEAMERVARIRKEREENPHIIYGLGHVSMFLRIYDSTMDHWMNARLMRAMQFSPKIVLDCSYDDDMTKREAECTAKQLMLTFAENRINDDPFDLHICNANLDGACMRSLRRHIPTMLNPEFPLNVHQDCFTNIFQKENLVYLTPHCRTDLDAYNADDIYIIGALVDNVNNKPLSLAKAKRLGLRMARLPLEQYLQWGPGSGKSLTLNQMINILLDLKQTGDWMHALRHVPRRKIIDPFNEEGNNVRQQVFRNRSRNQINVRLDHIMFNEKENESVHNLAKSSAKKFDISSWASDKSK